MTTESMTTITKALSLGLSTVIGLGLVGAITDLGLAAEISAAADTQLDIQVTESEVDLGAGFITHEQTDAFSIQYPQDWQVTTLDEDSIEIVSTEMEPRMNIHTTVQLLRENPETVVNRNIDQFVSDQVRVQRYLIVSVDNQSAFRVWMGDYQAGDAEVSGDANRPVGADANRPVGADAIATFVGYGESQTAILVSQYSLDNAEAEAQILRLHDSFANRALETATAEPGGED